jgi:hypothetical protein
VWPSGVIEYVGVLTVATDLAGVDAPASDFGFLLHKNPA